MNGRVYDPLLGRFLSPDSYVQSTYNTQSYNRYSYCLNNPLIYTDIDGYSWISNLGKKVVKFVITTVIIVVYAVVIAAAVVGGMALGALITVNPAGAIIGGIIAVGLVVYPATYGALQLIDTSNKWVDSW